MEDASFTIATLVLCVLSFDASAATPVLSSGNQDRTRIGITRVTDVEAGSGTAPGS